MDVSFDAFLAAARANRVNDEYLVTFRNGEPILVRPLIKTPIRIASPANGQRSRSQPRALPPDAPERPPAPPGVESGRAPRGAGADPDGGGTRLDH